MHCVDFWWSLLTWLGSTRAPSYEVFLSHSSADGPHVRLVEAEMEALGVKVYLAVHDPQPGTSVTAKVKAAIRRSDATVVLLTAAGADSAYVQQEIGLAEGFDKLVVPLVDSRLDIERLGFLIDREWIKVDFHDHAATLVALTNKLRPTIERRQREKRRAMERSDRVDTIARLVIIAIVTSLLTSNAREGVR